HQRKSAAEDRAAGGLDGSQGDGIYRFTALAVSCHSWGAFPVWLQASLPTANGRAVPGTGGSSPGTQWLRLPRTGGGTDTLTPCGSPFWRPKRAIYPRS